MIALFFGVLTLASQKKARIYQGNPASECNHSSGDCTARFVDICEKYAVQCCADTRLKGFIRKSCKSTYGASSIEGRCHNLVNWEEAKKICADVGARLCFFGESTCAVTTGCGYDDQMVWASDEEDVSTTGKCDERKLTDNLLFPDKGKLKYKKPCQLKSEWSRKRAKKLCPKCISKRFSAQVCHGPHQKRLELSLANQLYSSCISRCVYDYETLVGKPTVRGVFLYHRIRKCYRFVRKGGCFKIKQGYAEAKARAKGLCQDGDNF